MKKLTDKKLAGILGITPQNIVLWKKNKPLQYEAVRGYFFLKENNVFNKLKKIKSLSELVSEEYSDNKYINDLKLLANELDAVIKKLEN